MFSHHSMEIPQIKFYQISLFLLINTIWVSFSYIVCCVLCEEKSEGKGENLMNVSVYLNNEFQGIIPYTSLVGLSLFCEQQGLIVKWSKLGEKVKIYSGSHEKTIFVSTISNSQIGFEVVNDLLDFLKAEGINIVKSEEDTESNHKLSVHIDVSESMNDTKPLVIIEHHSNLDERLRNILITELNKGNVPFQFKELKHSLTAHGCHLNFKLLPNHQILTKDNFSMSLAKAIIRYVNVRQQNYSLNYLPNIVIKNWLKIFINTESHSFKQQDREKQKIKTEQFENAISYAVDPKSIQPSTNKANAEIYLNYTILPPRHGDSNEGYLIDGTLYMKNTGDTELINPVICIKVPQEQNVSLQGQIIPPKLVSGLSMKTSIGDKGWKYSYDDWREKIRTKGEYWITPIQELIIPPGEASTFSGFKLAIKEVKENSSCIVHAFVYFNDGKHKYSSNNSISFSF